MLGELSCLSQGCILDKNEKLQCWVNLEGQVGDRLFFRLLVLPTTASIEESGVEVRRELTYWD